MFSRESPIGVMLSSRQSPKNHPRITQESPKNHPRITQVCQGTISVEFRRTFEQIAGETREDCGGYSGDKGRNGEEVGGRFFYVLLVEKCASSGKK